MVVKVIIEGFIEYLQEDALETWNNPPQIIKGQEEYYRGIKEGYTEIFKLIHEKMKSNGLNPKDFGLKNILSR
ncbi:MAG: hypothetical protein KKD39_07070 [Candidatus Altiarchaeota archaeon]|nr:hypothetical protein [Candidatus Altiarchaeota archaeon]